MTYTMGQLWKHRAKWHLHGLGPSNLLTDSWVYILKSHTLLSEHYFLKLLAVASSLGDRGPSGCCHRESHRHASAQPFGHKVPESLGIPG